MLFSYGFSTAHDAHHLLLCLGAIFTLESFKKALIKIPQLFFKNYFMHALVTYWLTIKQFTTQQTRERENI